MTAAPSILYVITDLELGGVPLHLFRLALAMRKRGWRLIVASLAPAGAVGEMLREEGIEVCSCEGCCGLDYRVISKLGAIIDETRPELIHSFLFHANQAARIAAALNGLPAERVVCEIQTVEVERRWHLWVDRVMHRLCRLTFGNSPSVVQHLHSAAQIPRDRLCLVRGGIDFQRIDRAEPAARPSNLGSASRILMWVGRLDPVKGLGHLIRAMPDIAGPCDCHLLLVGEGPERAKLDELVRQLAMESRVHFLGPRGDVPSLLKVADVFVFPSRTEGLPNALLEAMGAGRAIVATDVPGCRDLITHEKTGLLTPYGDSKALGAAVARLVGNGTLAKALGERARQEALTLWNIEATWDAYEAVYRDVLRPVFE